MKCLRILLVSLLGMVPLSATAEPSDDATYIALIHLEQMRKSHGQAQIVDGIVTGVAESIERMGADIVDHDAFRTALTKKFTERSYDAAREAFSAAYREVLTPEELTALADFYRSPEGQALMAEERQALVLPTAAWLMLFGPVAPLREKRDELRNRMGVHFAENTEMLQDSLDLDHRGHPCDGNHRFFRERGPTRGGYRRDAGLRVISPRHCP